MLTYLRAEKHGYGPPIPNFLDQCRKMGVAADQANRYLLDRLARGIAHARSADFEVRAVRALDRRQTYLEALAAAVFENDKEINQ